MSVSQPESGAAVLPDFSSMTEEEQIAYAMQMSLAGGGEFHVIITHMYALATLIVALIVSGMFKIMSHFHLFGSRVWRNGHRSPHGHCRISQGESSYDVLNETVTLNGALLAPSIFSIALQRV